MNKAVTGLYLEWEFVRNCTKSFINTLGDEELDKTLPRKGLDTIRKHFQEMILVQKDYVTAIKN